MVFLLPNLSLFIYLLLILEGMHTYGIGENTHGQLGIGTKDKARSYVEISEVFISNTKCKT